MNRQVFGYQATTRNRIVQLEQTDDWIGALNEYGSIQFNSPKVSTNVIHSVICLGHREFIGTDHGGLSQDVRKSVEEKPTDLTREISDSVIDISMDSDHGNYEGERDDVRSMVQNSYRKSAEVERGRLRCLIELGHLDAVVDQVHSCSCCNFFFVFTSCLLYLSFYSLSLYPSFYTTL